MPTYSDDKPLVWMMPQTAMDYRLVAEPPSRFPAAVNSLFADGWRPYGPLAAADGVFSVILFRYTPPPPGTPDPRPTTFPEFVRH